MSISWRPIFWGKITARRYEFPKFCKLGNWQRGILSTTQTSLFTSLLSLRPQLHSREGEASSLGCTELSFRHVPHRVQTAVRAGDSYSLGPHCSDSLPGKPSDICWRKYCLGPYPYAKFKEKAVQTCVGMSQIQNKLIIYEPLRKSFKVKRAKWWGNITLVLFSKIPRSVSS